MAWEILEGKKTDLVMVDSLGIRDILAKAKCIRQVKPAGLGFSQEVVRKEDVTDIESDIVRNCRWFYLILFESSLS